MNEQEEYVGVGLEIAGAKVGWIYKLKKEKLITELQKLELDTNGTVDTLRARMVQFVTNQIGYNTMNQ